MKVAIIGAILIYFPVAVWLAGIIGRRLREEDAPKGRSQFHFKHPNASGLKLSVRVSSHQSASSDAG
jgi:hypothetical protein